MRYDGDAWGAWHNTAYARGDVTDELVLREGEIVTSVQTRYHSVFGYLYHLVVTTSAGRRWQQGGSNDYGVRGDFVARGRRLAYITSDRGDSDVTYYRTVFHWQ